MTNLGGLRLDNPGADRNHVRPIPLRVLLVEDSERLQRSVGMALRKSGYAVDVTGDGKEGLWFVRENEYDAIILDIMLPGLDGLSVLKQLPEAGKQTQLLLLTAKDTVLDRVRGLQMGANDYLVKPFALEELLARVHALCRRGYGARIRWNTRRLEGRRAFDTGPKRLAGRSA